MDAKPWRVSKTLWANLIGIVSLIVRAKYGYTLAPEHEVLILGIINMALRTVTKKPLNWKKT